MKGNNDKSNLAVISNEITHIKKGIGRIENTQRDFKKDQKELLNKVEENEKEIIRVKERQSLWNYGLAIFNVTVGALATFLGIKR